MKAHLGCLSFLWSFLFLTGLHGQACIQEDIDFETQIDIDSFPLKYPGCTTIEGDVAINDFLPYLITNLHGLAQLTTIKGDLYIGNNTVLRSLAGLENLDSIYGNLTIGGTNLLTTLSPLRGLAYIGGNFSINTIPMLNAIDTFFKPEVQGGINIENCQNLTDLAGLSNYTTINRHLRLYNCPRIKTLASLQYLETVGEDLEIARLDSLYSLSYLSNLKRVEGYVYIENCPQLQDLNGLESLAVAVVGLSLYNNTLLTSIDALENLDTDSIMGLSVENNPLLSACHLENLCSAAVRLGFYASINENGPGCQSHLDLLKGCGLTGDCLTNLVFETQADIDSFPFWFAQCTAVPGFLTIRSNGTDTITNLDGLSQITAIAEYLQISNNPYLENINGLQQLHTIGSWLQIENNDTLESLLPLSNLTSIGQGINIRNNGRLASLQGLHRIKALQGSLTLTGNKSLINLTGLDSLSKLGTSLYLNGGQMLNLHGVSQLDSIGGDLRIVSTNQLKSLEGLEHIRYVRSIRIEDNKELLSLVGLSGIKNIPKELEILTNAKLKSLSGLDSLNALGGRLSVSNNDSLNNLAGLQKLKTINSYVGISGNENLFSLSGLDSLTRVNGWLTINENPKLQDLGNLALLSYIGNDFSITYNSVLNNLGQLNSLDTIMGNLRIERSSLTTLKGLDSLKFIGEELVISYNDHLKNVDGLEGLHETGNIYILNGDSLLQIDALHGLKRIHGSLNIRGNKQLTHLPTLSDVDTIGTGMDITTNLKISSLGGLDSITYIGGYISIASTRCTNLYGLHNLKGIGGSLFIYSNPLLENLDALAGCMSMNGRIRIADNNRLTSIDGISQIDPEGINTFYTYPEIQISGNPMLSDCAIYPVCERLRIPGTNVFLEENGENCNSRLDITLRCESAGSCEFEDIIFTSQSSIDSFPVLYHYCRQVKGDVRIEESNTGDIQNLDSLVYLEQVGGSILILNNAALNDISGLSNATIIGGSLSIANNPLLTDLTPLNNIDLAILNTSKKNEVAFRITDNNALQACSTPLLCKLLTTPDIEYDIRNNATGCDNSSEIIQGCGFPTACNPGPFMSQDDVDQFPLKYPGCSEIMGDLIIQDQYPGYIENLLGLSQIVTVNGQLFIARNSDLASMDGLNNLANLHGGLYLYDNPILESLEPLERVNPEHVVNSGAHITIYANDQLTICANENFCILLASPEVTSSVLSNGVSCSSEEEILNQCRVSVGEIPDDHYILIYPNPATGIVNIKPATAISIESVELFDFSARRIRHHEFTEQISLEGLPPGMYMIVLRTETGRSFSQRIILAD